MSKPGGPKRYPWLELLIVVGLPLAVILACFYTAVTAFERGFTPIAATLVAPKGH